MSDSYKNIDDLFKDKFENFEQNPPGYIWENVKAGIGNPGNSKGGFRGGIAGFTALLVIIGTILVYLLSNSFTIEPNKQAAQQEQLNEQESKAKQFKTDPKISKESFNADQTQLKGSVNDINLADGLSAQNQSQLVQYKNLNQKEIPEHKIAKSSLIVNPSNSANQKETTNVEHTTLVDLNNLTYIDFEKVGFEDPQKERLRLNQKANDFGSTVPLSPPNDYGPKGEWILGLYFRPEMIRYPADENITNYSRGIDLHVLYKKNNLFIQTGLGYSRVRDAGNYKIDYNKYMGSYEDVYDVTYDTVGNQVIPIYHTQTVNIYDSVNYVQITPSERVYGYLDIPIMIGFGIDSRRFGWFVKAGPTLSLKLHDNIPAMNMSGDHFQILSVENSLPDRIKANWQFALSAGINYKLGNRVSLSIEPLMRYYINSDYEPGKFSTKHPFAFGLRTGLLLTF